MLTLGVDISIEEAARITAKAIIEYQDSLQPKLPQSSSALSKENLHFFTRISSKEFNRPPRDIGDYNPLAPGVFGSHLSRKYADDSTDKM